MDDLDVRGLNELEIQRQDTHGVPYLHEEEQATAGQKEGAFGVAAVGQDQNLAQ